MGTFCSFFRRSNTAQQGGDGKPAADEEQTLDPSRRSTCQRCEHLEYEDKQRLTEISRLEKELKEAKEIKVDSSCQKCEHKQSTNEEEVFYEKLKKAESALKQKEEELRSFKQRVAANVAVSLKTSNTESMNDPVSKTRLTEMYDNLKLLQWPKTKDQLKSRNVGPKEAKDLIQKTFGAASEEMRKRRHQIEDVFGLAESTTGMTPQKVQEFRQLTVQNLQMAVFNSSKEDLLKNGFHGHEGPNLEKMEADLRSLTSECFWLGCLMALNNPPLQPDWKNHVPSMDPWDIFPRNINFSPSSN